MDLVDGGGRSPESVRCRRNCESIRGKYLSDHAERVSRSDRD